MFVYEISPEPLNGFAPNSHGRHVWCLARMSLNVKVKGQGHQGQTMAFSALSVACVWFSFSKTSSPSSSTCFMAVSSFVGFGFYRMMHFSSKRGIALVILSVCLTITFVILNVLRK